MRAILIDPYLQTVTEVEITSDFHDILEHIQCSTMCGGPRFDKDSYSFMNDNGWAEEDQHQAVWLTSIYSEPLIGRCLIVGVDQVGETIPCTMDLAHVKEAVTFVSLVEVDSPEESKHES